MYVTFSQTEQAIVNQIITPVQITIRGRKRPPILTYGIWDTGSSHSGIASHIVKGLNLPTTRYAVVITGGVTDTSFTNDENLKPEWDCNIGIGSELSFGNITLHEAGNFDEHHRIGMLIGMDIISKGNLSIKHLNHISELHFTAPLEFKSF